MLNWETADDLSVAGGAGKLRGHGSDRRRLLPAGRSAADYSQQHWPGSRLRKAPLQFQQVSCFGSKSKQVLWQTRKMRWSQKTKDGMINDLVLEVNPRYRYGVAERLLAGNFPLFPEYTKLVTSLFLL